MQLKFIFSFLLLVATIVTEPHKYQRIGLQVDSAEEGLEAVIPPGANTAQIEALDDLVDYGLNNANGNVVTVLIRELP